VINPGGSGTASGGGSDPTPDRVLQRLDWQVVRRLDGLLQGDYRTLFRGSGLDLADLREYQPGDDVRAIDWNVTARTDIAHVREYAEDRDLTAWFLLDFSPSVDFGTVPEERRKRTVLIDFVSTLARLLTRRGNRVGAIFYGDHVERTLPAGSGQQQVLQLIRSMQRQPIAPRAPLTDLSLLLEAGHRSIKRRSLVFVVSDFISAEGWERPLALLNKRHAVMAIRLVDPREESLPDVGPVILEDAETGEQLFVDTADRGFRERFETAARLREEAVASSLSRAGIEAATLSTDENLVRAIVRMASLRHRRRRVA
jgi:uncharacterized protein (DUF58 family)